MLGFETHTWCINGACRFFLELLMKSDYICDTQPRVE
jgi:hypothetical protein